MNVCIVGTQMCTCANFNWVCIHCNDRSEGFPNGIFHPCALWDGGLARWKNCRRTVVVGVIWKMPKYKEMHTFSKMGMSEISRNVYLSEVKAPAGCQDRKLPLQELTPDELIHFPDNLKKWLFPIFVFLVTFYGIRSLFLPKTKMVRVVHMNIFYRMDLEIYDSKSEL